MMQRHLARLHFERHSFILVHRNVNFLPSSQQIFFRQGIGVRLLRPLVAAGEHFHAPAFLCRR
jgi:hypothetical protein